MCRQGRYTSLSSPSSQPSSLHVSRRKFTFSFTRYQRMGKSRWNAGFLVQNVVIIHKLSQIWYNHATAPIVQQDRTGDS
jgi:hypothetical protein